MEEMGECVGLCGEMGECAGLCEKMGKCVGLCGKMSECVELCGETGEHAGLYKKTGKCVGLCGKTDEWWDCVRTQVNVQDVVLPCHRQIGRATLDLNKCRNVRAELSPWRLSCFCSSGSRL